MNNIIKILGIFILAYNTTACIEEKDTELEKPVVELISPSPCDTLYFGESFNFKVKITDNTGLGNISMDLHNNFGHHNHGNHETCTYDPTKEAVNPYAAEWMFSLPTEKKQHIFDTLIAFPLKYNDTTNFDFGDYHFHIYVTDNDGYQAFTSLDVKLLYR